MTYTPAAAKNALRIRVQGQCPVKYTIHCSAGTDPVPDTISPDKNALVNCGSSMTVKSVDFACESASDKKCKFAYEVVDI